MAGRVDYGCKMNARACAVTAVCVVCLFSKPQILFDPDWLILPRFGVQLLNLNEFLFWYASLIGCQDADIEIAARSIG